MFSLFKIFKHKSKPICLHTHQTINDFIRSFDDEDIVLMYIDVQEAGKTTIEERVEDLLSYLKDKCVNEDYIWICDIIHKEYKK